EKNIELQLNITKLQDSLGKSEATREQTENTLLTLEEEVQKATKLKDDALSKLANKDLVEKETIREMEANLKGSVEREESLKKELQKLQESRKNLESSIRTEIQGQYDEEFKVQIEESEQSQKRQMNELSKALEEERRNVEGLKSALEEKERLIMQAAEYGQILLEQNEQLQAEFAELEKNTSLKVTQAQEMVERLETNQKQLKEREEELESEQRTKAAAQREQERQDRIKAAEQRDKVEKAEQETKRAQFEEDRAKKEADAANAAAARKNTEVPVQEVKEESHGNLSPPTTPTPKKDRGDKNQERS
ncbi:MAG: hypothetical protein K0T99_00590, partial [Alphaproteobacteria bacterium]|nr:hypothetical protein [Alphaproteobacteria bacterium]